MINDNGKGRGLKDQNVMVKFQHNHILNHHRMYRAVNDFFFNFEVIVCTDCYTESIQPGTARISTLSFSLNSSLH